MPKFAVKVALTVRALYIKYPILKIEAESEEAAVNHVSDLIDQLENNGDCEELARQNHAFVAPRDFDSCDYEGLCFDTTNIAIYSIQEVRK